MSNLSERENKIQLAVLEGEPRINSRDLATGLGVDHSSTFRLVKTYEKKMEEFGKVGFKIEPSISGQKVKCAFLNESQAIFLTQLSRNTETVVQFKLHLTKLFEQYRNQMFEQIRDVERRAHLEWQRDRSLGKVARKEETEIIKEFVAYATSQGSSNADRYYLNFTRLVYQALFGLDIKKKDLRGVRDRLDGGQLNSVEVADRVIAKTLKKCMEDRMFYKSIYQEVKKQITLMASVIGKSVIPSINDNHTHALLPPKPTEKANINIGVQ